MDSSAGDKTSPLFFGSSTLPTIWDPQRQSRSRTLSDPEPFRFSDDEPLNLETDITMSSDSSLEKVCIESTTEREAIAASESLSRFSVLVGLKAPSLSEEAIQSQHAPIDLVTVLDVSGSMHGSKIALLKRAVNFVIDNLGPSDRLSIISFSGNARRVFPLRRMTQNGREDAKIAVDSLQANGMTNIVQGLSKGVRVLEERRCRNPVSSIMFLSDGMDTCNNNHPNNQAFITATRQAPGYLRLLPSSIRPCNKKIGDEEQQPVIPVHTFGFGSDHDPLAMHAISDESGGTFSFIESYEMVQDAFASCIGGLLSVVIKDLRLVLRSASHGVRIGSIHSGRYASEIRDQGFQGTVKVGDLYADEERKFLIDISVAAQQNGILKTSLLEIACSYHDCVSEEEIQVETDLVEIKRPKTLAPEDAVINLRVDGERNRIIAAQTIAEAQRLADAGDLTGARALLSSRRMMILDSVSGQARDDLTLWLDAEIREMESRMEDQVMYATAGRAYGLSCMSALDNQRATARPDYSAGAPFDPFSGCLFGAAAPCSGKNKKPSLGYFHATPHMARMVKKSQMANNKPDVDDPMEE